MSRHYVLPSVRTSSDGISLVRPPKRALSSRQLSQRFEGSGVIEEKAAMLPEQQQKVRCGACY